MTTPDEIAREAAEESVTYEESAGGVTRTLSVGAYLVSVYSYEHELSGLRAEVAKIVLAAIERALREVPVPGGLSAERLAQLWERAERLPSVAADARERYRDLRLHVEHLTRALHDCGQDGSAAQYAAGYEAGKARALATLREMREAEQRAMDVDVPFHDVREMNRYVAFGDAVSVIENGED